MFPLTIFVPVYALGMLGAYGITKYVKEKAKKENTKKVAVALSELGITSEQLQALLPQYTVEDDVITLHKWDK